MQTDPQSLMEIGVAQVVETPSTLGRGRRGRGRRVSPPCAATVWMLTMSDMPERIWAWATEYTTYWCSFQLHETDTPYVRADVRADVAKEQREYVRDDVLKELLDALKGLDCTCVHGIGHPLMHRHSDACKAVKAAIAKATEGT